MLAYCALKTKNPGHCDRIARKRLGDEFFHREKHNIDKVVYCQYAKHYSPYDGVSYRTRQVRGGKHAIDEWVVYEKTMVCTRHLCKFAGVVAAGNYAASLSGWGYDADGRRITKLSRTPNYKSPLCIYYYTNTIKNGY